MTELHVVLDDRAGTWRVYDTDPALPLSQHTNASDAESGRMLRQPHARAPKGSGG